MTTEASAVAARRTVHYESFDDLLADAQRLAAGPVRSVRTWSLGQTLKHLGLAMQYSIDGGNFTVPWWVRGLGILYLRRRMIKGPWPEGLPLPRPARDILVPGETPTEDGLAALRAGIDRLARETKRVPHPVAGRMSVDEWNQLHLRHAELHMSFLLPA